MSFANTNYSDILATTIENRSKKVADNVTKNNAILTKLSMKDKIKPFSGGHKIIQELSFAENSNAGFYSGYDTLPTAAQDVISAAEYNIKQAAVPVTMSGLEDLQNSSKEQMIDLMESRLTVAESSMANLISDGLYSDGTGYNGREIDGLGTIVVLDPTSGTPGNINRANFTFWRNQVSDNLAAAVSASTIQGLWNTLWSSCSRGSDMPDLIMCDDTVWGYYVASLQSLQRFSSPEVGDLGFPSLKYMGADVIFDGGIGGYCPTGTAFFLNCDYLHYRPHSRRNMTSLSPNRRVPVNQDAEVQILAWAGNLTCSGAQFQGHFDANGT